MADDSFKALVKFYLTTTAMLLRDLGMSPDAIQFMQAALVLGRADLVEAIFSKDDVGDSPMNENEDALARLLDRLARVTVQMEGDAVGFSTLDEAADVAWHLGKFSEAEATARTAYNFYEIAWHFRSIMDAPALPIAEKLRVLSDPENVDQYHGAIWRLAIERVHQSCAVNGEWLEALDAYELALSCPMESPTGQRGMCEMLERRLRMALDTPISELISIYFVQAPAQAIAAEKRRQAILHLCGEDPEPPGPTEITFGLELLAMVQGQAIFDDMRQRFLALEPHDPYIEWSNIAVRHERLSGAVPLGRSLIADVERTKWLLPDLIHEIGHGVALLGGIGLIQSAFRTVIHFIEAYLVGLSGNKIADPEGIRALHLLPDHEFSGILGLKQLHAATNATVAQSVWTPWLEGLSMYYELVCDPKDDPTEISAVHECLRLLIDFDIPRREGESEEEYLPRMMDEVVRQFEEFFSRALHDTARINTLRYFEAPQRGESDIYILGFLTVRSIVASWEVTLGRRLVPARAAILLLNATQGGTLEAFPALDLDQEEFRAACQSKMINWLADLAALSKETIEKFLEPLASDSLRSPTHWEGMRPKKVTLEEFITAEEKRRETNLIPQLFNLAGIDPSSSNANERKSADALLELFNHYVIRSKLLPIGNDEARMLLMQNSDHAGICPRTYVGKRKPDGQEDAAGMPRYSPRFWPMEGGENEKNRLRRHFGREGTARLTATRVIDLIGFPYAPCQTRMSYICFFLGKSYTHISAWVNPLVNLADEYPEFAELLRRRCVQAGLFHNEQNTLGSVRFLAKRLHRADALPQDLEELLALETKALAINAALSAASAAFTRGDQSRFAAAYKDGMCVSRVRMAIARIVHASGFGTNAAYEPGLEKSALASIIISQASFSGVRPFNS